MFRTSRIQSLGSIKRFQADDYITIVAIAFYTTLIVTINIVAKSDSNLLPPGFDVDTLTKQQILARQYGSKLVLVVEQCQIQVTWCMKLCLLILYQRLTVGTKERFAIKILFIYVSGTWLLMEILYFGVWCRPFTMYWYGSIMFLLGTMAMDANHVLGRSPPLNNVQLQQITSSLTQYSTSHQTC